MNIFCYTISSYLNEQKKYLKMSYVRLSRKNKKE